MLGDFTYYNPTKLFFGKDALDNLGPELRKYGKNILLVYGGGSIKRNGIYDKVINILKKEGKNVFEDSGVMPNPTIEKVIEGVKIARDNKVDFILAIGGGSVIDYSKALSVSIHYEGNDIWEKYYERFEEPTCKIVPVGSVLTMVGTGSEMNCGSVITNFSKKLKIGHVFQNEEVFPKFAILNPEFTYTVPKYQMVSGIYDIMSHILEQYFSGTDDNTSDYIMEGLMRSLIHSSLVAIENNKDYEARSNIMWIATWALNTFIAKGKTTDWEVHMLGQAVAAYTNATHGMTLAAVSMPYYHHILPYGLEKFKRFAINVWNVDPTDKSDKEIALEGLDRMKEWMIKIGLVMNITDLGATKDMLEGIVNSTLVMAGGYKVLTKDEIREIIKESY
ncbi:MAG: iron-containing alcohol dehydrogenase [Firmicutes bacterium]|uniref:Iron-containing alcohol dehydrogenase n=1 Tax=Candidatus Onthovivens merdipullorum TaxID=2840889 RepID=A0A9D9DLB7_9BACL|nr:iron-containing alcohol dehydrogenase [Candidatus Onthovivens merdipullorum]